MSPDRDGAGSQSGFALLFIYAMAATIAIMLYLELPRVAFEAQRDKEQLLIDRGEQYSRAITLYVRKFNRYPPDFDALDSTQNLRFLRGHYKDPMTGKDDWRLVHVGPGGVFTDSLVYNKKKATGPEFAAQSFITEVQQTGGNPVDATQGVNIATRARPSDQAGTPGDPNNPQAQSPLPQPQAGQGFPNQVQPDQFQPNVAQPGLTQPGLPQFDANGQVIPATVNGPDGQPLPPGLPGQGFPNQPQPGQGQAGRPGVPANVELPFGVSVPSQSMPTPVIAPGVNIINQLLTTPRPGGLNGSNGQQPPAIDQYGNPVPPNQLTGTTTTATPGTAAAPAAPAAPAMPAAQVIGGGIAGVASKREQEGIKIYGDRTKYNEWEFVYDVTKDKSHGGTAVAPQPAAAGAAGAQQSQSSQQQPTQQSSQQQPSQMSPVAPTPPVTPAPAPSP